MCFETTVGIVLLCVALIGVSASYLLAQINWPMVYFILCGGMEDDR